MSAVRRRIEATQDQSVIRQATLARATARREKLQAMFDNASFVDMALRQGRYLRLCAAIAWASEREERARDGAVIVLDNASGDDSRAIAVAKVRSSILRGRDG